MNWPYSLDLVQISIEAFGYPTLNPIHGVELNFISNHDNEELEYGFRNMQSVFYSLQNERETHIVHNQIASSASLTPVKVN